MSDLKKHCAYIAENLELMVNDPDKWMEENEVEDTDCYPMGEWLDGALDIEFVVGYDGEYRGCRIMVAYGGPNIYVNTRNGCVEGRWWGDKADVYLDRNVCDAIDEYMREIRSF